METGGVLRPPVGPPIPLNVDFAAEIQPHLGKLLGRGGFGAVYEATWRGKKVAVKLLTVDTEEPAVLDAFLKEVALCACLRGCSRIVRLLGACLGGVGGGSAAAAAAAAAGEVAQSAATAPEPTAAAAGRLSPVGEAQAADAASSSRQSEADGLDTNTAVDAEGTASPAADNQQQQQQQQQPQKQQQQQQQQQLALIMELVEGGNLAQRIYHPSKRRLTYMEVLQIGLDVAAGLAYLHPAVLHRDLKPQNVLLDGSGRAKIADFGISRFKDPTRSYLSVTHQGGTPNYMAPELFNGTRVDEAADVYSLGCILYECLAHKQPFSNLAGDGGKSFNMLFKIIVAVAINKERPALPPDTPPRLAALISSCWREEPGARPRVAQLAAELQDLMQEELQQHAQKLSRLRRLSGRSSSLPNQQAAAAAAAAAGAKRSGR
ncbi:hypothetical protein OEZ86_004456 [Tetradesmus obliquus]|nr:hypothetical protein OEZ86_004456 [Tetradesmus obliquus]